MSQESDHQQYKTQELGGGRRRRRRSSKRRASDPSEGTSSRQDLLWFGLAVLGMAAVVTLGVSWLGA